jgi:hypothetical protein
MMALAMSRRESLTITRSTPGFSNTGASQSGRFDQAERELRGNWQVIRRFLVLPRTQPCSKGS